MGIRAIVIGDSRASAGAQAATGEATYLGQRGHLNWFQALFNHPFEHIIHDDNNTPLAGHNVGVGGETTEDMMARFKVDVLDEKPGLVIFVAGTNDLRVATQGETIARNIKAMADAAIAEGALVWIHNIEPRNDFDGKGFTTSQEDERVIANKLIKDYCYKTPQVQLIDVDRVYENGSGESDRRYTIDGVHQSADACYQTALQEYAKAYAAAFGDNIMQPYVIPEDYDATAAPYGNMVSNGDFSGTTGTATGPGVTGTVADGWVASVDSGTAVSVTASKSSRIDMTGNTNDFQTLVISSDGTGLDDDEVRLRTAPADITTGYTANEYYRASVEIHIENADTDVLRSIYLQIRDINGGATTYVRHFTKRQGDTDKDKWPRNAHKIIMQTPPVEATHTKFRYDIYIDLDGTVDGDRTVHIGNALLERLPHNLAGVL